MTLGIILNIQDRLGDLFKFTQTGQIGGLVSNLVGVLIAFASLMLLFYFVWSGFRWMSAGGDKAAVAEARSRLNNALMGFLIVLASWAIYTLIRYMLGLGAGAPAGPSPAGPGADCYSVCQETSCHGYDSFCYKDCRCICNSAGEMWYYDNPWCDAEGDSQFVCKNGARIPDSKGVVSGQVIETCPGNQ